MRHHKHVTSDLDERLAAARSDGDPGRLVQFGCDLAEVDRQIDAEFCFRRAVELGETWVSFNLGNALAAQNRWTEAIAAYEEAVADGESDAWLNMGQAMEELGDFGGAIRAYRESANAGDSTGASPWRFGCMRSASLNKPMVPRGWPPAWATMSLTRS